jgi:hypothetical protein
MLRKTLVTLTAIAALGVGSTAMAAHMGGGGGGGWGGGGSMMHGGRAPMMGGGGSMGGPMMMHGGPMTTAPTARGPMTTAPMTRGPMTTGRIQGWNGRTAWGNNRFHVVRSTTTRMTPAGLRFRLTMAGSGLMFAGTTATN